MEGSPLQRFEAAGLRCLLSLPPAEPARPRPLLCFLHGLGEGPPTEIHAGLTAHGPLRRGSTPRATGDFIVVAPQLPARGDLWRFYADGVVAVVREIQARHGGDRRRTYLTGFSFGGNGVLDLALCFPGLWAALWPVDPTRVPISDPGLPVWLSAGAASRPGGPQFIERLRLQAPSAAADRIYLDEGYDHVGSATSAYRDERIYAWLLTKNLET
jgi:predicted peptidase